MSFLNRRNSRPQLRDTSLHDTPYITARARAISSSIGRARSSQLIKRVSMIFSSRKKDSLPPHLQPLSNIGRRRSHFSSRTASLASSDDIRPPSGLGFCVTRLLRANSLSSEKSLPSPPCERLGFHHERSRCLSSPGVLRSNFKPYEPPPWVKTNSNSYVAPPPIPAKTPLFNLPTEVLDVLLSFLPRGDVVSFAVVSKRFSSAVRKRLYGTLDLRTIATNRVERLNSLLAFRPDLAEIVHTLICDRWPPWQGLSLRTSTYVPAGLPVFSSLPASSSTFSTALCNMRHLTTLTLPSFSTTILRDQRAGFRLKELTLLNSTMSLDEQTQLFAWLVGQPDIISLSFPNLIDQADHKIANSEPIEIPCLRDNTYDFLDFAPIISTLTPTNSTPVTPSTPYPETPSRSTPSSPFIKTPLSLLPLLTHLHAPPTLTTILAPTRPLQCVTIYIRTNLDTGLRPLALMASLQGIPRLNMRFGENVDKRSVEKVMRAAAKVLGDGCERLDLDIGVMVSDEVSLLSLLILSNNRPFLTLISCPVTLQNHPSRHPPVSRPPHPHSPSLRTVNRLPIYRPLRFRPLQKRGPQHSSRVVAETLPDPTYRQVSLTAQVAQGIAVKIHVTGFSYRGIGMPCSFLYMCNIYFLDVWTSVYPLPRKRIYKMAMSIIVACTVSIVKRI